MEIQIIDYIHGDELLTNISNIFGNEFYRGLNESTFSDLKEFYSEAMSELSEEARSEAKVILDIKNNIISSKNTIHDVLAGTSRLSGAIHQKYGVDVIPGDFLLSFPGQTLLCLRSFALFLDII